MMSTALKALLEEWSYVRGLTKHFIESLSNAELDHPLPRQNLNTIRKHCEELLEVQACYVEALQTGAIRFDSYEDSAIPGSTAKDELLAKYDRLDALLVDALTEDGRQTISWFGEQKSVYWHIAAMISHESMHVGQMVAFCYAVGIELPSKLVNTMALSG